MPASAHLSDAINILGTVVNEHGINAGKLAAIGRAKDAINAGFAALEFEAGEMSAHLYDAMKHLSFATDCALNISSGSCTVNTVDAILPAETIQRFNEPYHTAKAYELLLAAQDVAPMPAPPTPPIHPPVG